MSLALRIPSLIFILRATLNVLRRFPATMAAAVLGTVAVLQLIAINDYDDLFTRLFMVSALGLSWLTAAAAMAESMDWPPAKKYGLVGIVVILLALYCWQLDPKAIDARFVVIPRFFALLAIGHLLAAVSPYLNRGSITDFWEYNKELFSAFVIGAVFTLILWGGLSLAMLAVQKLFDFDLDNRVYLRLFVVLAGLFHTTYFLHHFPTHYAFTEREVAYNVVFKNLCKYILLPIVLLYFFILYAYSAKILATWTLPQGWVSSLVLGFSVAGIFAYLINYLLPNYDQSPIVRNFHKWFWPVLLPMVVLLFTAIGRRISDYGVTEARFMVAHAGVWLLVTGLYFVISGKDNIKFIPISLAAFILVAIVGPFNAFNVSQRNQLSNLESLLIRNGRLMNGKINQSMRTVSEDDANRIESCLEFLETRKALYRIQPWFDKPLDSLKAVPRQTNLRSRVIAALGMEREKLEQAATVYVSPNAPVNSGSIRGYNTFYKVEINQQTEAPGSGNYVAIADNKQGIAWREKKGTKEIDLEVFDLHRQINEWLEKSEYGSYFLPKGAETIDFNGNRAEMRLVIFDVSLIDRGDHAEIDNIRGMLFLKDKIK